MFLKNAFKKIQQTGQQTKQLVQELKAVGQPEELLLEDDLNYISSASAAVLQQTPRGGQTLLWAVAAFFMAFLLWAAWAEVDEFTRGNGKVIPSQYVQVVQNLEGGILAELYVAEGDQVQRNQTLLRIDDTRFSSSLREADVTLAQLRVKAARLFAEAVGLDFSLEKLSDIDTAIINQERALYDSRQQELLSNTQVFEEQMAQKRQEVSELEARIKQLAKSYELVKAELDLTRPLAQEGAISKVELLRLERQVNDLDGELNGAKLALPRARSSLEEAKKKLANLTLVFQREARQELNEVNSELSRLQETSGALVDRVQRTLVKTPVAGTVKRLLVKTIGGVIQPGMDIVEVVPSEEKLLVEAKIRPADIAFLYPGQLAKVKFTAYDFSILGGLEGEVVHLSPDTIVDDEGNSFYLVKIETQSNFSNSDQDELPIIPGMTVTVDILTGKKSVLDYLLKPILKTKQAALRER